MDDPAPLTLAGVVIDRVLKASRTSLTDIWREFGPLSSAAMVAKTSLTYHETLDRLGCNVHTVIIVDSKL
jgi:hypothetical protein